MVRHSRISPRIIAGIAACSVSLAALSGCSLPTPGSTKSANNNDKNIINIVATTTQICDYVTQIVEHVDDSHPVSFMKTDGAGNVTQYTNFESSASSSIANAKSGGVKQGDTEPSNDAQSVVMSGDSEDVPNAQAGSGHAIAGEENHSDHTDHSHNSHESHEIDTQSESSASDESQENSESLSSQDSGESHESHETHSDTGHSHDHDNMNMIVERAQTDHTLLYVNLTCLLAPNASAHEHEATATQMQALGLADLMLVNGIDLEHFLDDAVSSSGFKGVLGVTSGVLTAADVDDPQAATAAEADKLYTVDRGIAAIDVQPWPFEAEDGEADETFTYDPHVWMDPQQAALQVRNIGSFIDKALPAGFKVDAGMFAEAADSYAQFIETVDKWAEDSFASLPAEQRIMFTSHDAFGYFAKRYGIDFIGSALSDFNSQQDATLEHIQQAVQEVIESGATVLFAENSNSAQSIEAVANAAGVKAIVGEDALYGDSLGPEGSDGQTYIESVVHNVTIIVEAWGGQVAAQTW